MLSTSVLEKEEVGNGDVKMKIKTKVVGSEDEGFLYNGQSPIRRVRRRALFEAGEIDWNTAKEAITGDLEDKVLFKDGEEIKEASSTLSNEFIYTVIVKQ